MDWLTRSVITEVKTLESLQRKNLEVSKIQPQTYKGASAMRSDKVGVQKLIRNNASLPLPVYSHCAGHCLNLVNAK